MAKEARNKDEVFIPELEMMNLADQKFKDDGQISFLLSRRGGKRLRKIIALNGSDFGRLGRSKLIGNIVLIPNALLFFYHTLFAVFFDSRLYHASTFYLFNQYKIKDICEYDYQENPRCTVISYVQK